MLAEGVLRFVTSLFGLGDVIPAFDVAVVGKKAVGVVVCGAVGVCVVAAVAAGTVALGAESDPTTSDSGRDDVVAMAMAVEGWLWLSVNRVGVDVNRRSAGEAVLTSASLGSAGKPE